ncbi:hypothetical protein ACR03S_17365 (plasmid) [Limimaricola variabilis]
MTFQSGSHFTLGVATRYGQGGRYDDAPGSDLAMIEADFIRDGLNWHRVEATPGFYDFSDPRSRYLDEVLASGGDPILTLLPQGNPNYQGGKWASDAAAIDGFADFVVAVLDRFPGLGRIEIGNEFNSLSTQFVSGEAASGSLADKAALLTRLLQAVSDKVGESHPEVQIIGAGLHSMPTGFVQHLADAGAFAHMDALSFHPYGLSAEAASEALDALDAVLDRLPADQRPALLVTEFGQSALVGGAAAKAAHLVKMTAALASHGVDSAAWYSLYDEDRSAHPEMGLFDRVQAPNDTAATFAHLQTMLETGSARRVEADGTLRVYELDPGKFVIWGAPQALRLSGEDIVVHDLFGRKIATPDRIGVEPIFVEASGLAVQGGGAIADSHLEFDLQQSGDGGWSQHIEKVTARGSSIEQVEIMGGQERADESWNPYLGSRWTRPLRIDAAELRGADFSRNSRDDRNPVDRYVAEADGPVDIAASYAVGAKSADGIAVSVRLNGVELQRVVIEGAGDVTLRGLMLREGDRLDFVVEDNGNADGDVARRHIRLFEAEADRSEAELRALHRNSDIIDGNEMATPSASPSPSPTPVTGFGETPVGAELRGTDADDRLSGSQAADIIRALAGDDVISAGRGDDFVFGGAGHDVLKGRGGDDRLDGGDGDDRLYGDIGADVLLLGLGDDWLRGDMGRSGPRHADIFVLDVIENGRDVIHDFSAEDRIDLRGASYEVGFLGSSGRSTLIDIEGGGQIVLQAFSRSEYDALDGDIFL